MTNEKWDEVILEKIELAKKRGARKRGWIKLDKTWLTSSINYRMNLGEMTIFSKLLLMADEFGSVPGLISDNDFRPMPHEYLAHQAFCSLEVFEETLKKGIEDDSIYENSHGIFITHFDDYQFTEYDRQRPYRQEKQARKQVMSKEEEKEIDIRNDIAVTFRKETKRLGRVLSPQEQEDIRDRIINKEK